MNLRALAEADLAVTLEDAVGGFGWPVTLTDPNGVSAQVTAQSNDVSQLIDQDTGVAISGRRASAVVRISTLTAAGLSTLPTGVAQRGKRPWTVQFDDINGSPYTFKVTTGDPDRALGVVVLLLEAWSA